MNKNPALDKLIRQTELLVLETFCKYLKEVNDPFRILTTSEIEKQKETFIKEIL